MTRKEAIEAMWNLPHNFDRDECAASLDAIEPYIQARERAAVARASETWAEVVKQISSERHPAPEPTKGPTDDK